MVWLYRSPIPLGPGGGGGGGYLLAQMNSTYLEGGGGQHPVQRTLQESVQQRHKRKEDRQHCKKKDKWERKISSSLLQQLNICTCVNGLTYFEVIPT